MKTITLADAHYRVLLAEHHQMKTTLQEVRELIAGYMSCEDCDPVDPEHLALRVAPDWTQAQWLQLYHQALGIDTGELTEQDEL